MVGRDGLELPPGVVAVVTNGRVVLAEVPPDEDQTPGDGCAFCLWTGRP